MSFVHLHVHSEFSLLDGACSIKKMPKQAKEMGQKALAITDHGVMYGAVAFYEACQKEGIKPIIGCEVYVARRSMSDRDPSLDKGYTHLILLCKNDIGYHNLCYLVSMASLQGFYMKPRIDWDLLHEHSEGLICLSGCLAGEIQQKIVNGDYKGAKERALDLYELFGEGNFYLELQTHGIREERIAAEGLIKLHRETKIPLAMTNDAHYLKREDAKNQDVLMCIQMGKTVDDVDRMKFEGSEFYLKSEEEMEALFPEYEEAKQAIENTAIIAENCNFDFVFGKYHLPTFPLPEGEDDAFHYLRKLCQEGFEKRYVNKTEEEKEELQNQLSYELNMINKMGFTDYFLITSDFIAYAKNEGIPVGPGRGSAAGSIVSFCLDITDVDPVKYSLFFERFLNPERVSMPDIDIDFCVERRGEVIDYVNRKYGSDHVAQIVTFGTMAARGAIRDVGRALGVSYAVCDAVAKQVPTALGMTLDEALSLSKPLKEMYEGDEQIHELIDTARALEGTPRHASTHAAGVVISSKPVYEYVPLAKNDESTVCQFPMTTLEHLGLLKMDFLGLRNLTVLERANRLVRKNIPDFDVAKMPDDDKKTFEMLSMGKTSGVFQLESQGITAVCTGLKPKSIEDITAVIALYRPGPMDSIPRFLECSNNPKKISYKHELLEPILNITYGCIVYQEQVIEIFRQLAGYSLGQADIIRRAMSKKKHDVIDAERVAFVHGDESRGISGAMSAGVPEQIANSIYSEIVDFANYAFNKAHAVSYAVVSYRTAYMKCHYPREYMAALLSSVLDNTAKVIEYIAECTEMGIKVLPPDVNESEADFTVSGENLRFGLVAIKNIGRGFINSLMKIRDEDGAFKSFDDFCKRLYGKELNKRALESLIRSGAFDSMGYKRSALMRVADTIIDNIAADLRRNIEGQLDLFSFGMEEDEVKTSETPLPDIEEYTKSELLAMEKETTGLYLSGHPMDAYIAQVKKVQAALIGNVLTDLENGGDSYYQDGSFVTLAGIIQSTRTRPTRNGSSMAYIILEDTTGTIELVAFGRLIDSSGAYIKENSAVVVKGKISVREERDPQITLETLRPITEAEKMVPKEEVTYKKDQTLWVKVPSVDDERFIKMDKVLKMFLGKSKVIIYCEDTKKRLSSSCLIHEALIKELKEIFGEDCVVVK